MILIDIVCVCMQIHLDVFRPWFYLVSYHISDFMCCIQYTQVAEVGAYAATTGVLFQATVSP